MISETVMTTSVTENRNCPQATFPQSVIYLTDVNGHSNWVMGKGALLALMRERDIRNKDIAAALKLSPSRITELYNGGRDLSLDEAVTLVETFGLDQPQAPQQSPAPPVSALPASVARLIVQYLANELNAQDNPDLLAELAEDVRAFAQYVTDPKVRDSVEAAEAFFQAMRVRRPSPAQADRSETDPD